MAIAKTLYEKIVESHTVKRIDDETVLLYVDEHFANEYTSPQAFSGVRQRGCGVFAPESHLCVVDHIIPSADLNPRVIHERQAVCRPQTWPRTAVTSALRRSTGPMIQRKALNTY